MVKYGVPYKGSKNAIAEKIIDMLPPAENFYDVFAGGGAIAQCAMESGKYKNVYANDIDGRALRLFFAVANGKLKNESRWISREEFMKNRSLPIAEQDPYIACCWSFGNNMIDYLYAQSIEPYKRAMHYAVVYDDWRPLDELVPEQSTLVREAVSRVRGVASRRAAFGAWFKRAQKKGAGTELAPLCRLENLERLQSLDRLGGLRRFARFEELATFKDYQGVEILPDSVIYCDPPYAGTSDYGDKKQISRFDYEGFYTWTLSQKCPVFISGYEMPGRFICVASFDKTQQLAANTTRVVKENVYIPYHQTSTVQKQLSLFDEGEWA